MPPMIRGGDGADTGAADTPPGENTDAVTTPPDAVSTPAVVETTKDSDTVVLRLVNAFGPGDTFTYPEGEDAYVVGVLPTPVPAGKAEAIIDSARSAGLQIETVDTSKEG